MTRTHLLQTVCAVAMLAAAPAFAQQTETPPGATGPHGTPNPVESQHSATTNSAKPSMAPANDGANTTVMAPPAAGSGSGTSAMKDDQSGSTADSQSTHRSAMTHPTRAMHSETDTSQDAAVDQLNDRSFKAARQGQAFSSNDSTAPAGMSNSGMSGSAPGGAGSK